MRIRNSKISDYEVKKILKLFSIDLTGTQSAKVDTESVILSDGRKGYDGLVDVGYDKHYRVVHGENEWSKGGGIHINGIENFWSFAKRRMNKFNGVKKNFHLHLKESEFRYGKSDKEIYNELIEIMKKHKF